MKIQLRTDILIVEDKKSTKARPDGTVPQWKVARALIRGNQPNEVLAMGVLRVPKALESSIAIGTFNAEYTIATSDYGDSKGEIQFQLVDLKPVNAKV
jgi:hypothetical protein